MRTLSTLIFHLATIAIPWLHSFIRDTRRLFIFHFPRPLHSSWQGTTHSFWTILPPLDADNRRLPNPKIRTAKFETVIKSEALLYETRPWSSLIILLDDFRRLNVNWRTLCTRMWFRRFGHFFSSFHVVLAFSVRSYAGKSNFTAFFYFISWKIDTSFCK